MIDPNSIVDYLGSKGQATDRYSRAKLYGELGLDGGEAGYNAAGSNNASQNTALLNALRARNTTGGSTTPPANTTTPPSSPTGGVPSPYTPTSPTPAGGGVTTAPTPPANPTPASQSAYDAALAAYKTALESRNPTPEQLSDKQRQIQEVTDALNAEYNSLFSSENKAGAGRDAQTRALNLTAGLGGSSFGAAASSKTKEFNQKQIDLLTQEKAAKLAAAIQGVEDRTSQKYRQEYEDNLTAAQGNLELQKKIVDDARSKADQSIKDIAGAGASWDKFKTGEPAIYQQLLDEYGGDEMALHGAYNASLPSDSKVAYENKIIKGSNGNAAVFRYGLDPSSGTVQSHEYDLGVPYDTYTGDQKPIEVGTNGTLVVPDGQGGYRTVAKGSGASGAAGVVPKGSVKSGSLVVTPDQMTQIQQHLKDTTKDEKGYSIRGTDNYTDPYVYQQAAQDWIDAGGLEKDFYTQFPPANYINPVGNANLPVAIRNNKNPLPKKSTTTTPSGLPRP